MTRPIETMLPSAHFTFSHGHLLKVAAHDETSGNHFAQEELWMAYTYWKKGYKLYSPYENVVYHNYDVDYRHNFISNLVEEAEDGG